MCPSCWLNSTPPSPGSLPGDSALINWEQSGLRGDEAVEKFFFEDQLASATFPRDGIESEPEDDLFGRCDDIHVGGWRSCPAPGPPFGPLRLGARTRLPKSLATCHHGVGPASTEAFAARLLDMLGAKPVVA